MMILGFWLVLAQLISLAAAAPAAGSDTVAAPGSDSAAAPGLKSAAAPDSKPAATAAPDCDNINPLLVPKSANAEDQKCHCFEDAFNGEIWIGCSKAQMPDILNSLKNLENSTSLDKVWIWDSLVPMINRGLFQHVRPEKLIVENSMVSNILDGALSFLGDFLQVLELKGNSFTGLESGYFKGLKKLKSLDLSQNYIQKIGANVFSADLANLNFLSLQKNHDEEKSQKSLVQIEDGAFFNLKSLSRLNLAKNRLTKINEKTFEGLSELEFLNLEGNRIEEIHPEAFAKMLKLKILILSENKLKKLEIKNLPQLERLILDKNEFSSFSDLNLQNLPKLQIFNLDINKISEIPANLFGSGNLPNLKSLSITRNLLQKIDARAFEEIPNLETLSLQSNEISELPPNVFRPFNSLTTIFLSGNKLQVTPSDLGPLPRLATFSLANNQIQIVTPEFIQQIATRLRRLSMQGNKIQALPNETQQFNFDNLESMDLSGNDWSCNCEDEWFIDWIMENKASLMHPENTVCKQPSFAQNVAVTNQRDLSERKKQCNLPSGVSTAGEQHGFDANTNRWITILGCVLGIVSLMILTGIAVLFFQEHRAALTAQVSPLTPKKLRRVPSDMETLIPPKSKSGAKHVTFMEITMGGGADGQLDDAAAAAAVDAVCGASNEASEALEENFQSSSVSNSNSNSIVT